MEKIVFGPADFNPVIKEAGRLLKDFGEHVQQINSAMYSKGFLDGIMICAIVLTALWAFTRKG